MPPRTNPVARIREKGNKSAITRRSYCQSTRNQRRCLLTARSYYCQKPSFLGVKTALDARELNKYVVKDKYPMPNLDNLMNMIAKHVEQGSSKTFFTTLDLTYAYGQVELGEATSRQCNFQKIGGAATGIYRIVTELYGLTTMPT